MIGWLRTQLGAFFKDSRVATSAEAPPRRRVKQLIKQGKSVAAVSDVFASSIGGKRFALRGHNPITNAFEPRWRQKVLRTQDGRWSEFPSLGTVASMLRQIRDPQALPEERLDLPVWGLVNPATHALEYVASFMDSGSYAKFSLGLDARREICGLLAVRFGGKGAGESQQWTTSKLTSIEDFQRQNRILTLVKSVLAPKATFVVDNKGYAVVEAMSGDCYRLATGMFDVAGLSEHDELAVKRAIGRGAAAEVRAWHAAGVMHRDLKLDNFMWRPPGVFVLGDPGLAHEGLEYILQGAMGTSGHIPPEVLLGRAGRTIDRSADMFSLGMMLMFLHGGQVWFPGEHKKVQSFREMRRSMEHYIAWRQARSQTDDPDGPLDWNKVAPLPTKSPPPGPNRGSIFARLDVQARLVQRSCPQSADYIYNHLARIRPENRDDAEQAVSFLQSIGLEKRDDDEVIVEMVTTACENIDPQRDVLLKTLYAYYDEHAVSTDSFLPPTK